LILLELRMMEVVVTIGAIRRESSSQIVTISKPTSNFLQARCLSCRPTSSATRGLNMYHIHVFQTMF